MYIKNKYVVFQNPESQDGSGSEGGEQLGGGEADDLSDNATADPSLSEQDTNRLKNLKKRE